MHDAYFIIVDWILHDCVAGHTEDPAVVFFLVSVEPEPVGVERAMKQTLDRSGVRTILPRTGVSYLALAARVH